MNPEYFNLYKVNGKIQIDSDAYPTYDQAKEDSDFLKYNQGIQNHIGTYKIESMELILARFFRKTRNA